MPDEEIVLFGKPGRVPSPREVVPGKLFQSGAAEAIDICQSGEALARLGIRAVITVAHDVRLKVPSNLVHLHLPVDELNPTDPHHFQLAANLGVYPALVHCMAGANRSRVFAAAIAWKGLGVDVDDAIRAADPPPSGIVFESMMKWAAK